VPKSPPPVLARYVTEILTPVVLVSVLLVLQPVLTPGVTWLQAVVSVFFVTALPLLILLRMKRGGLVTDHHVRIRQQRAPVLVMAGVSLGIGTVVLLLLGAPAALFGEVGAIFLGLVLCLLANLVWKLSVHSAVAAYVALALLSPIPHIGVAAALMLTALVGWSRIELRDHTPAQVMAGQIVGCCVYAASLILP
jgi:membrane-associated phospholipid phosphatase